MLFETLLRNIYTLLANLSAHTLRLQAQSVRRLSVKCINVSKVFLKKNKKSIKIYLLF